MREKILTEFKDILDFLVNNGSWGIIIILFGIIVYFLINPDKVEKWSSIFSKMFSFFSTNIEKKYISKDIQYKINSFGKDINEECTDLVPYETEIKFIKPSSFKKESCEHIKEKVIVFMKDRHNQDENFINAALMSTEKTLIPNSRLYIDKNLMRSVDLQFIKNLTISKNKSKIATYVNNYFAPEIKKKKILRENIQTLEKLTEQGIFTRILLQELKDYGMIFYPKSSNQSIIKESRNFFDSITELANKKHHEDIKLHFKGDQIKVSFILIGISSTVYRKGNINIEPYKQRIFKCEEDGMKTVYILAWGRKKGAVKKLSENLDLMPERFEKLSEHEYKIELNNKKRMEAICLRYKILSNSKHIF